ncbi:MAG: FKBP-type peptidyl-prolyl cis-trans isomerase, partial [Myxococcota bacterium]
MAEDGSPKVPVDVAAAPADALKTATGIPYKVLVSGTGTEKPTADARVRVQYSGWTTDGEQFDSSYRRKRPAEFSLKRVIPGWTEGLQEMVAGERRIFWIPEEKAYAGKAGKPAGMLVFDVELLEVNNPPTLPDGQGTAPSDAAKLESGVAIKTLTPGTGSEKPKPDAKVKAHFTAWTTEGKFLQSSMELGRVPEFRL